MSGAPTFALVPRRAAVPLRDAIAISASAQAGVAMLLAGVETLGAILVAAPLVTFAHRRWGRTGALVALAGCFLLSCLVLIRGRTGGGGSPLAARPATVVDLMDAPTEPEPRSEEGEPETGDHAGVILLVDQPSEALTLPPPDSYRRPLMLAASDSAIVFSGAYWLYRHPYQRPPRGSTVLRGEPDARPFRSTGRVPVRMEARQNLGGVVPFAACRAVAVHLRNADSYPDTVQVGLTLVNTAYQARIHLGWRPIRSRAPALPGVTERAPAREVVTFLLSSEARGSMFDEIVVSYRLAFVRSDRTARIAVEKFEFLR